MSWDDSTPTKTSAARDLDIYIRDAVKKELTRILGIEHDWTASEAGNAGMGQHKKGTARINFGLFANRPAVNAENPGAIYIATDGNPAGMLYYDNGVSWVDLGYYNSDDAASANTVSKLVIRDASGNFAAGEITGAKFIGPLQGDVTGNLTGNAATATSATSATNATSADSATTAGNADTLDTFHANAGAVASTIPVRDASGILPGDITGKAANADLVEGKKVCWNVFTSLPSWAIFASGTGLSGTGLLLFFRDGVTVPPNSSLYIDGIRCSVYGDTTRANFWKVSKTTPTVSAVVTTANLFVDDSTSRLVYTNSSGASVMVAIKVELNSISSAGHSSETTYGAMLRYVIV